MTTAVLLLNFGEPEHPVLEEVVPFLERIFMMNNNLEGAAGDAARARAQKLAQMRAPGLIEEYEMIGGSPLAEQAREQGQALERELRRRGHDVIVILGILAATAVPRDRSWPRWMASRISSLESAMSFLQ